MNQFKNLLPELRKHIINMGSVPYTPPILTNNNMKRMSTMGNINNRKKYVNEIKNRKKPKSVPGFSLRQKLALTGKPNLNVKSLTRENLIRIISSNEILKSLSAKNLENIQRSPLLWTGDHFETIEKVSNMADQKKILSILLRYIKIHNNPSHANHTLLTSNNKFMLKLLDINSVQNLLKNHHTFSENNIGVLQRQLEYLRKSEDNKRAANKLYKAPNKRPNLSNFNKELLRTELEYLKTKPNPSRNNKFIFSRRLKKMLTEQINREKTRVSGSPR